MQSQICSKPIYDSGLWGCHGEVIFKSSELWQWRYAARARARANMKFYSDTLAFDINTMLVFLGGKVQGGLSLDVGLERKVVRGR